MLQEKIDAARQQIAESEITAEQGWDEVKQEQLLDEFVHDLEFHTLHDFLQAKADHENLYYFAAAA